MKNLGPLFAIGVIGYLLFSSKQAKAASPVRPTSVKTGSTIVPPTPNAVVTVAPLVPLTPPPVAVSAIDKAQEAKIEAEKILDAPYYTPMSFVTFTELNKVANRDVNNLSKLEVAWINFKLQRPLRVVT